MTAKWVVALTLLVSASAFADDYRDARAELVAAYQSQDYPAMVQAAQSALRARPGYPGGMVNLALAHVLDDQPENALAVIAALADKGLYTTAVDTDNFASMRALAGWPDVSAAIHRLSRPVGNAEPVASLDDGDFIPEGIAVSATGGVYIGSIRNGSIVRLTTPADTIVTAAGHWSVFGMRFHPDGSLWFASSAVAQFDNAGDDLGRSGLFRLDPEARVITRAAILPDTAETQVLGDLIIADSNTIYTTDSITGAVYQYDIDADQFTTLVEPGKLGSPQGLTMDAAGESLYVADYIGGLFRVSLQSGGLTKLPVPAAISDYGIDGLYRYRGELIAIQNGFLPHRIVALQLDDDGVSITGERILAANLPEFDEPTLGAIRGNNLLFTANSHWNRFDRDNRLPEGLSGPVILRLPLDP